MNECMNALLHECINACMHGWLNRWTDIWIFEYSEYLDRLMEDILLFATPISPEVFVLIAFYIARYQVPNTYNVIF